MDDGHDVMEPGLTGNEHDSGVAHVPFVRHVHSGWRRDEHGQWVAEEYDESQWEVVCPQCGDTDGPAEAQTGEARALRGPYRSKHKAEHAANHHVAKWDPRARWTPGGTFPLS